jgi:hypothetical protein
LEQKISVDNIEERTKYLNSNEFWNDIPRYFKKLSEVYSKAVFAFILKSITILIKNLERSN